MRARPAGRARGARSWSPALPLSTTLLVVVVATLGPSSDTHARSRSVGSPEAGQLEGGFQIPLSGAHHRFVGPVASRGTQWATLELAALIARVARAVDEAVPGPPLVLGDMSVAHGGEVARHASHESGRDADLLFYLRDASGRRVPAEDFLPFDGTGRCARTGCERSLDIERTWWAVRTLVASRAPAVQWIFVSAPLEERLLRYARERGEHAEILKRAGRVLHQPRDALAHDDHLHVRIYCSTTDGEGCVDAPPRWSWVDGSGRAARIE